MRERLTRDAENAVMMIGPDNFNAEEYAEEVMRGERIDGWPL